MLLSMFDNELDRDDRVGARRGRRHRSRFPSPFPPPACGRSVVRPRPAQPPAAASPGRRRREARTRPSPSDGNGGRSTAAVVSAAATLPVALPDRDELRRPAAWHARASRRAPPRCSRAPASRERYSSTEHRRRPALARYPRGVISVVIPVHNEERSVALLYDELAGVARRRRSRVGGRIRRRRLDRRDVRRPDAPPRAARQRARRPPATQLRQGGGALGAGFARGRGEIVVTIDGDLQDDPAEIPRLLAKLDEGYDLVSGWKANRRDPDHAPHPVAHLQHGHRMDLRPPAPRPELRAQGVSGRGRRRDAASTASSTASSRCSPTTVASGSRSSRSTTAPASTVGRATAMERYVRGFLDLLTVTFMGRYRHRPLHLFGGIGLAARADRDARFSST